MSVLPKSVEKVIEEFERLPGVGPKSASRMAYHFLRAPSGDALRLADALENMEENVTFCTECYNASDKEICDICSSPIRNQNILCVVEEPLDVVAFEKGGIYDGLYFVLGGAISPADGIGEEELRFGELNKRVRALLKGSGSSSKDDSKKTSNTHSDKAFDNTSSSNEKKEKTSEMEKIESENKEASKSQLEIIIATNPSLEGQATASFIQDNLKRFIDSQQVSISRLAMGLPTGADLEYADRLTLKRALEGRTKV